MQSWQSNGQRIQQTLTLSFERNRFDILFFFSSLWALMKCIHKDNGSTIWSVLCLHTKDTTDRHINPQTRFPTENALLYGKWCHSFNGPKSDLNAKFNQFSFDFMLKIVLKIENVGWKIASSLQNYATYNNGWRINDNAAWIFWSSIRWISLLSHRIIFSYFFFFVRWFVAFRLPSAISWRIHAVIVFSLFLRLFMSKSHLLFRLSATSHRVATKLYSFFLSVLRKSCFEYFFLIYFQFFLFFIFFFCCSADIDEWWTATRNERKELWKSKINWNLYIVEISEKSRLTNWLFLFSAFLRFPFLSFKMTENEH